MKKIVRLTESDLVRLVNRVINEQNSQVNNVQFWNEYSKKMANYLKGKMFDSIGVPENTDKYYYPVIKFMGYLDRAHTAENIPLNQVKDWGMMFNVIILKSNGLPNTKDGQMAQLSIDFTYRNGNMVAIKDVILFDKNTKFIAKMPGWTAEDLGGFEQWSLVKNSPMV